MKIRHGFAAAMMALTMICCFFTVSTAKADGPPEEAPMFCAVIEWSPQGYIVKGTFTEFPPDISRAETLYSLDGEVYQTSGIEWNITNWSDGSWTDWDEDNLKKFQNQTCLYSNTEPLKSYLAGKLDCFYVKLRLTRENGITYETQGAVIDRGSPQPVPDGMTLSAGFAPSIRVRTFRPFSYYGRYQITVSEEAAPEKISAFLPDTLPVEVNLQNGIDHIASGIIECPVTWKPLSDLTLTAGESVTILDAAEEIIVPVGSILNTPLGIFQLNEPLGINQDGLTDEVRLVLNVVEKDSSPTGALSCDYNGLSMAFHQKPTKATAIRAYTLSPGETKWTELTNLPLLEAVNAQPSTAGSGYTYVLDNTHELYQSYMTACNEGREPSPFIIGIKIEGGVYDGKQLILPWPDTYDPPLDLPELGGSGGNEDNAGADNKGDSTDEGQRPNLPQDTDGKDTVPSGGKPGSENLYDKGNGQMNGGSYASAQAPAAAQPPAVTAAQASYPGAGPDAKAGNPSTDTAAKTGNPSTDTAAETGTPAADTSLNAGTDSRTKSPAQTDGFSAPAPSGKEERPGLDTKNSSRLPLLIFTSIAAFLCIVGVAAAAAVRRSDRHSKEL